MLSQKVVENFFKRARFRRSKRLRSSLRSSLIKRETEVKATAAAAAASAAAATNVDTQEDNNRERCGLLANDQANQSSRMSAGVSGVENGDRIISSSSQIPSQQEFKAARPKTASGASLSTGSHLSNAEITSSGFSEKQSQTNSNSEFGTDSSSRPDLSSSQLSLSQPSSRQPLSCQTKSSQPLLNSNILLAQPLSDRHAPCQSSASDTKIVETLQREVEKLRKELSTTKEVVTKLQDREKVLINRLSEQAQRQLQKGSSKFEDLSLGECRPTQLIKRYGNLYSESRLDALDALDEVPNMADCEDLKVKLLLSIVVLAFRSAEKTMTETKLKLRELLHIPRVMESSNSTFHLAAKDIEESVAVYLRKTVDRHDISKSYKDVCERVWVTLYDYPMLKECQGLLRYIDESVRIAWAMAVQNPPFAIDYESKMFNDDTHVRFHMSDPESSAIKSVLWPTLMEGKGGPCVSKGVVLT